VGNGPLKMPKNSFGPELNIPQDLEGCYEFGWETRNYTDIGSKINWVVLQLLYLEEDDELLKKAYQAVGIRNHEFQILEEILKEVFCVDKVNFNLTLDGTGTRDIDIEGYIDHQSVCNENYHNLDIFESKETLKQFLFCPDSYIVGGNDNSP
jgi:hypothetical protein